MPGSFYFAIWFLCTSLEASFVVCALLKRSFGRYLTLNLYMGISFLVSLARFYILLRYGFSSDQYLYLYYYSDALLTICLYFTLLSLYSHIFDEMGAERYLRFGATLLLGGTAVFSYLVIQEASDRLLSRFVVEISQNLYFVGMVLTYVLWGAVLKLRETRARLVQLVLALGVYFSAFAANYALRNIYPGLHGALMYLLPLTGMWLPAAWTYTFLRVSEDDRLVPAHLALKPR